MTKQTQNNKNQSNNSGGLGVVVAVVLVGTVILLIITSFAEGGGLVQPLIIFFTAIVLVVLTLIRVTTQSLKESERSNTAGRSDRQTIPDASKEQKISAPTSQTRGAQLLIVGMVFGLIGIIAVYFYVYRENTGANVEWIYRTKPEDSRIVDVQVTGSETTIKVKTQSGNYYYTSPYYCEENCWFDRAIVSSQPPENYQVNDPSCKAKALPPPPPEGQISDELIFKNCEYETQETRIIISKDGGLWIWYKWISSWENVVFSTTAYSFLVAPAFALIGVLMYKWVRSSKN